LHPQVVLLRILERRWLSNLLLSLVLIRIGFMLAGVMSTGPGAPKLPLRLVFAVLYAPAIWTSTFAIIVLALRFMSTFSPTRRYIADASYWLHTQHITSDSPPPLHGVVFQIFGQCPRQQKARPHLARPGLRARRKIAPQCAGHVSSASDAP
jgi:hypothetical protein